MTGSRSNSERLKVGIIGGGAITQVAHLPVLKKLKMIEIPRDLRHRPAQGPRPRRSLRRQGRLRRHRGSAPLRGAGRGGDLLPDAPARVAHSRGALGRGPRAGGEAAGDVGRERPAHRRAPSEKRQQGGDGGHEPPLPARRADRPQLRAERASWGPSRACAAAGTSSAPVATSSAGGSGAIRRAEEPCWTSGSPSSIWDSGWAETPRPCE